METLHMLTEEHLTLVVERTVTTALGKFEEKMVEHVNVQVESLRQGFKDGFPNGDVHGHRIAHEKFIDHARKCATLKEQITGHIVTWGVMATIGWLVIIAWEAVKREISR